ncbi:hypothetical protein BN2537_33 [Streptomyces venezuelae]|nr:hypothetical protein BN2537_33 [Streptomyces venezuelae]
MGDESPPDRGRAQAVPAEDGDVGVRGEGRARGMGFSSASPRPSGADAASQDCADTAGPSIAVHGGSDLREDGERGTDAAGTRLAAPIANASKEGAPPPYPRNFQAVNNQENFNRPEHGLWCSPVTAWSADGAPTATAWTAWLANPGDVTGQPSKHDGTYSRITAAKPLPEAQIYLIDTEADLDRLVAAFPLPPDHLMYRSTPTGRRWPQPVGTPCT